MPDHSMTDEPATTPAADRVGRNPFATEAEREAFLAENTLTDVPDDAEPYSAAYEYAPAADRVTALTLRIVDLREQRDQARRERDAAWEEGRLIGRANQSIHTHTECDARIPALEAERDGARAERDQALLSASVRQDTIDKLRRTIGVNDSLSRIAYKARADLHASAQLLLNDLIQAHRERDEARAEAVAATTKLDDLRHRIAALHRPWYEYGGVRHDNTVLVTGTDVPADHVCRVGPEHQRCVTYPGHPDETEHEVLACVECRQTTLDGEPGELLWPCPTIRALEAS